MSDKNLIIFYSLACSFIRFKQNMNGSQGTVVYDRDEGSLQGHIASR
jgi:hypothetical protein